MKNVTRYVVKMRNGDYMVQSVDDNNARRVLITTVDHPIDGDLFKDKSVAARCVEEILAGEATLDVEYNKNNPPVGYEELYIDVEIK
ncbi:hypothetical protein WKH57_01570 [Niallia taxi]|uniref:hypothetical protein n=1 Tax=Niallia taxi TaxID=2499688 RepID=UPI00317CF940